MKFLFEECDANLVNAKHMESNPASGRVMQKAGMKLEGALRSRVIDKNDKRNNLISYSIKKEEFVNLK